MTKGYRILKQRVPLYVDSVSATAAAWLNEDADGWEAWGGSNLLSIAATKKYRNGTSNLLCVASFMLYVEVPGHVQYMVRMHDGTTGFGSLTYYLNIADHLMPINYAAQITTLGAGVHTLTLQCDVSADVGGGEGIGTTTSCSGWLQIWEVPVP